MLANTPERSGLELLGDAHNGPEGLAPLRFTSAGGCIHARDQMTLAPATWPQLLLCGSCGEEPSRNTLFAGRFNPNVYCKGVSK